MAKRSTALNRAKRSPCSDISPPGGSPYFLVDTTGNGNWMRRDSLDDGVRVPMVPVYTFD